MNVRVIKNYNDKTNFFNSKIGDIYVSLASIDTVALIDPEIIH